jgi:hypothetical protein
MNDMTCVRCKAVVSPQLIDFLEDGAVCRNCIIAEASNPAAIAKGERDLMRSMGWRQLIIGIVMLVIGIAILSLGLSGSGGIVLIPTGMLIGGVAEIAIGISKLSRS